MSLAKPDNARLWVQLRALTQQFLLPFVVECRNVRHVRTPFLIAGAGFVWKVKSFYIFTNVSPFHVLSSHSYFIHCAQLTRRLSDADRLPMSTSAITPAQPHLHDPVYHDPDDKKTVETYATDLEADDSSSSEQNVSKLLTGEERKEIVPVEAFKWNVEGDQSPCMCF